MAQIKFENSISFPDPRFITLGQDYEGLSAGLKSKLKKKIGHSLKSSPRAAWATLGWADGEDFNPTGTIQFSEVGNLKSKAVTLEEVKNIYEFNPQAEGKKFVTERYINFDKVSFGFEEKKIRVDRLPELRLTLFLQPDEGAVVFYQFSDVENHNDEKADVQYVMPNSTGADHSTDRDRLNYFFPIIPHGKWDNDKDNPEYLVRKNGSSETSFVIKILTYKRHHLNAEELFLEGLNQLKLKAKEKVDKLLVAEKYDLLKFDGEKNDFIQHGEGFKIDYSAKTLLLVHGTFSTTAGSFGGLYDPEYDHADFPDDTKFLKYLLEKGDYEQILAFDHPTIWHDAITNSSWLYNYFSHNKFDYPVDLIGTSRGAILCHQLASDSRNKSFKCGKVLAISGGFGVGYFGFANGVSQLLKIVKKVFPGAGTIVGMIAQFSIDFFLKLPGCRQMTPDSKRLKAVIYADPSSTATIYQNIQVDWHKSLVKGLFKRSGMVLLDAIVKMILGKRHDLVVGYEAQRISPEKQSKLPLKLTSTHTKNLISGFPKEQIRPMILDFLTETGD